MADDDMSGALVLTLIDKERQSKLPHLQQGTNLVNESDRDAQVRWMCTIAARQHFGIDTLSLAVAIFDRVLTVSRVNNKYVNCVALSSLYLAVKVCEELDAIPPVGQLLSQLRVAYSQRELVRMEMAILSKLEYDVGLPTVFRFVQVLICAGGLHIDIERELRPPLELLLANVAFCARFRPSLLALAMLSLAIESCRDYHRLKWLAITVGLQRLVAVDQQELIECRETISAALGLDDKENSNNNNHHSTIIDVGSNKKSTMARKRHRLDSAVGQKPRRHDGC